MKKTLLEKIQNIIYEAVLNEFKAAERGSQAERARYKACVRKAIKCGSWPAFYKKHHADYDFLYSHNLLVQFYKDTGFTAKHSKNAIIASDVKLTDLFELAQNYDSYKDFVADNPKLATLINHFKTEIQEVCFPKNDYKESNYGYNHQQKLDNLKREFENAIHEVLQKDCYLTNKDEHAFIFVMDPNDPHLMPITLGRYYIPAVLLKYFNTDVKADLCTRYNRADVNALFNNFTTKEQIKNNIYVLPEDCRMITYSDIRHIPYCRIISHELDPNLFKMLPKAVYRWLNDQTISIFYGIREEALKRVQWHFNDSNYNPNKNLKTSTK